MGLEVFSLEGKVAIVTGGGRNIGKAIALGLAEAGADVVVAARTSSEIEQTALEIEERGRRGLPLPADVRDAGQVENLVRRTLERFGKVDILVNNAGGMFPVRTLDMSEGAWEALLRENLKSAFLCTRAVVGEMATGGAGGCIINIVSTAGLLPYRLCPAYAAAKAGLIHLTRTLALELAPYGIRVNAIAPGMVLHPGSAAYFYPDRPEKRSELLAKIPLRRFGTPQDIVGAAVFLASPASGYITGAVLRVDGGQLSW